MFGWGKKKEGKGMACKDCGHAHKSKKCDCGCGQIIFKQNFEINSVAREVFSQFGKY